MRHRALIGLTAAAVLALAACGGDDDDGTSAVTTTPAAPAGSAGSTPVGSTPDGTTAPGASGPAGVAVVAGEPFPDERCAQNEAAGTITYLSGFDFAATASIIDVVMAEQQGYYDELCLDVELKPGFSTSNYPIVAGGEAQVASGGSFSEVVDFASANDVELVAIVVEGRSAIDSLIMKPGEAATLEDVAGATIGVKGKIPASVAAMLAGAGLVEGTDYETVLLDGFDPIAHYNLEGIAGFPGYKSNEPGQLDRAGVAYDLFDPTAYDVPGSFGVIFATKEWVEANPTAVEDFVRATMRGLADALADPAGATQTALELVEANGNPSFLSAEGEAYRWGVDAETLNAQSADGTAPGVIDLAALQAELDAYAQVGLFGGTAPDAAQFVATGPVAAVYDGTTLIWPSS